MTLSKLAAFLSSIVALAVCGLQSAEFDRELALVSDLGDLTAPPKYYIDSGNSDKDSLKSIYFDALDYKGKPTRVFAWLGLPESRNGKVPGIVLVHGGGGSAFKEWVQKWNDAGFAAISIAVEGQTDAMDPDFKDEHNPRGWVRHRWAGPRRDGIYGDMDEPIQDQWMYHAVADTVLANSLLRSLPEVNAEQVGVMGISWGGVITSTVMGIDNRFAFAIPTYGCGHLFDADNQYGRALGDSDLYKQVWDPMVRLHQATMPALWLSWPGDQHFPMDCLAECYSTMPGDAMVALIPGMKHSHPAGWNPPDSYAFARSVVENSTGWCLQKNVSVQNGVASVTFETFRRLDGAVLVYSTDSGFTGQRTWQKGNAFLDKAPNGYVVDASLPENVTGWFVNVHSDGLTASSWYCETDLETEDAFNQNRERWLFLGDSITMAGHYVDYVESWLLLNKENAPEIIDLGLGSETVSCLSEPDHPFPRPCLHSRLEEVLDRVEPDKVFACYGMNCAIYHPFSNERFAAYQKGIMKLAKACKSRGAEVVLITPPPYAGRVKPKDAPAKGQPYGYKTPAPDYNEVLQHYADWILSLDEKDGIQSINIRPSIERFLEACYPKEPVHPNNYGHELIGEAILRGLGYKTGSELLESGTNSWISQSQWATIMDLVSQQRMSYDRSLLNSLGHGNPSVMKRETLPLDEARLQNQILGKEIKSLSGN